MTEPLKIEEYNPYINHLNITFNGVRLAHNVQPNNLRFMTGLSFLRRPIPGARFLRCLISLNLGMQGSQLKARRLPTTNIDHHFVLDQLPDYTISKGCISNVEDELGALFLLEGIVSTIIAKLSRLTISVVKNELAFELKIGSICQVTFKANPGMVDEFFVPPNP